ncbi:MurR/RpiR family transcriptional regulator [Agrococcus baldri]|uniref:Transcriptional regulator n=1 Tax=Agrococcus baldri TaxID=153730 RepID=A0AA87RHG4_9MICO|nr:MurR/RpiR family transcriptional regulator [Agrococcus baldri]GEK79533.1 transcriptional regulator [Agrococcus baldri]
MSTEDATESLYARATRLGPELPGTLSQVAAFFALHPDQVAGSSALEIAAAVGTSDASVIRTARALGYAGMKDVRQAALALVAQRADPGELLQRRMHSTADGSHLRQVVADSANAIEQFRSTLDDVDWEGIVDAVAGARKVFCYGLKPVGYIAEYLAFFLVRTGVDAQASKTTGVLLADELLRVHEGDAAIVFAPIRQFDEVATVVRTARAEGATVVLITEAIGMPIRTEADYVITTAPTSLSAASDASIPLMVAHALVNAVSARNPARALAALDRLNTLRPFVTHQRAQLTAQRLGIPTGDDARQEHDA